MKKYFETILLALLLVFYAAGCGDGNGKEDADADAPPDITDPQPEDVVPDPTPDDVPTEDVPVEVPEDVPEEETTGCPPDNPPDDIYINVAGMVQDLTGAATLEGIFLGALDPMDALTSPTPTPLLVGAANADGTFLLECIDVGGVGLGLIIMADDPTPDGPAGDFFPTITGVASYATDADKVDIPDAAVFANTNDLVTLMGTYITELDPTTTGFIMGIVVDETTHAPIDGATVTNTSGSATIYYLNADLSGVETDDNTSTSGIYVIPSAQTLLDTNLTAEATGYTFGTYPGATIPGVCFFLPFNGEPG